MSVIGLDLSLTAPGMCVPKTGGSGWKASTLHTDPKTGDRRFCEIRDWIESQVRWRSFRLAMIEEVPHAGDQAGSHLQRVHGVAREMLARHDVPFAYVNVTGLKHFATGRGDADKADVMATVTGTWGIEAEDDNASDAAVLAVMGQLFMTGRVRRSGIGLLGGGAKAYLPSMSAVAWPLRQHDPDWPQPYGPLRRKPVTKKCGHRYACLKSGDAWIHPFTRDTCDRPPK